MKGRGMDKGIRVTVWNEGVHERQHEAVKKVYPKGMGRQIAQYLKKQPGIASVHVSELSDPDQGLTDKILKNTDVMTWWGHMAHHEVTDENAARVQKRVLEGMGLVVLHSGHLSKPFVRLMGTGCMLKWRGMLLSDHSEMMANQEEEEPISPATPPSSLSPENDI